MEEFILNQELLELLSVSDCTFVKEYCKKKLFSEYVPLFFQCATYIKYY